MGRRVRSVALELDENEKEVSRPECLIGPWEANNSCSMITSAESTERKKDVSAVHIRTSRTS